MAALTGNKSQPGRGVVVTTTAELIGIGVLAFLAGTDDELGDVIVIFMWGVLLGWFLLHANTFASWVKKI